MLKTPAVSRLSLAIEYYREENGRWLADIPALPGVTLTGELRNWPRPPCRRWRNV
jgi:hypothetical protein